MQLNKIFENNIFNGLPLNQNDVYLTFKAKSVHLPKKQTNTILNVSSLTGISKQSLRMYFSSEETENERSQTYEFFNDIIEGKNGFDWEENNTTQKVVVEQNSATKNEYFLQIIKQENRELVFSNLLSFYLKNKDVLECFAKDVLNIQNFRLNPYSISREEKNIDIFIYSASHCIVIENKIHSALIKEKVHIEHKINEWFNRRQNEDLPVEGQELLEHFRNVEECFQTDRYYAYACSIASRYAPKLEIRGYVLCPNYAVSLIKSQMEQVIFKDKYKLITYEQVYNFFEKNKNEDFLNESEKKYVDEFLRAMKPHTKDVDDTLKEEMERRFYKIINNSIRFSHSS